MVTGGGNLSGRAALGPSCDFRPSLHFSDYHNLPHPGIQNQYRLYLKTGGFGGESLRRGQDPAQRGRGAGLRPPREPAPRRRKRLQPQTRTRRGGACRVGEGDGTEGKKLNIVLPPCFINSLTVSF